MTPPAAMELGTSSGFEMMLMDRGGSGHAALFKAKGVLLESAEQQPAIAYARYSGMDDVEQYDLKIDNGKAGAYGLSRGVINSAVSAYTGRGFHTSSVRPPIKLRYCMPFPSLLFFLALLRCMKAGRFPLHSGVTQMKTILTSKDDPFMKTKIETERLRIRNFVAKDAKSLLAYLAHPRANCFINERIGSLKEAAADIARRSKDELQYAVCLKEEDTLIGNLFAVKEEPDTYSVGWNFNGQYEGKGYASEAAKAFLTFLFMSNGARRIYAYVEEDNIRSKKMCERLGMRREGLFIEFISFIKNPDGTHKYENTFSYAVLKKDWKYYHAISTQNRNWPQGILPCSRKPDS